MVLLYYNKDAKTGLISDVKIDLKEAGMGVPGLIGDSMVPLISVIRTWIVFDLAFTMEARLGSMEKDGITFPLPFPAHQCSIHGHYNTRTAKGDGTFKSHS